MKHYNKFDQLKRYYFVGQLLISMNVNAETKLVTIDPDKYQFNTVQVTAILSSDIKELNENERCIKDAKENGLNETMINEVCNETN